MPEASLSLFAHSLCNIAAETQQKVTTFSCPLPIPLSFKLLWRVTVISRAALITKETKALLAIQQISNKERKMAREISGKWKLLAIFGWHRLFSGGVKNAILFYISAGGLLIWWVKDIKAMFNGTYFDQMN